MPAQISASGVLFLAFLVFIGPIFYLVRHLYRDYSGYYDRDEDGKGETDKSEPLGRNELAAGKGTKINSSDDVIRSTTTVDEIPGQEEAREEVTYYEYLFGLIGYSIGIGNVWRFPYLVGRYGGGSFVTAYLICLFFCSLPLFLMELGLGQFLRKSSLEAFEMIRPRWKNLGIAQFIANNLVVLSYYNVLLCYALIYVFSSCETPLPWIGIGAETYWSTEVLNEYKNPSDSKGLGSINWKLVGSLFAIYCIVFFAVAFGKEVLAQVTWVTVSLPVLLIIVLLLKAVSLPGANDGIEFYIGKFDAVELLNGELWAAACGQILFSLAPGTGTALTLTSFAKKNTDVYKTALIVAMANSGYSLFAGFAMFSVLGNLAHNLNVTVATVAFRSGMGLAFVSIAEGMTHFGAASNVMSVLFFSMLLLLGFDSTFAMVETGIAICTDILTKTGLVEKLNMSYFRISLCLVILLFFIGLPYTCRKGGLLMDVVDHFIGSYFLLMSCFLESIMFTLDFGWERLKASVKKATENNVETQGGRILWPEAFWNYSLKYSVPFLCASLLILGMISDMVTMYGAGAIPGPMIAIGWCLFGCATVFVVSGLFDTTPSSLLVFEKDANTHVISGGVPAVQSTMTEDSML